MRYMSEPSKLSRTAYVSEQVKHCVRQCNSYPRQNEPRIIHDVLQCCYRFPDLSPTVDTFSFRQTHGRRLVSLSGKIQKAIDKFSCDYVPLRIWIMPYYPNGPPLVFVLPSNFLNGRLNHPHVDHDSGLVYTPYLSSWVSRSSSVIGAVESSVLALTTLFIPYPIAFSVRPVVPSDSRSTIITSLTQRLSTIFADQLLSVKTTIDFLQNKKQSLLSDRLKLEMQSSQTLIFDQSLMMARKAQLQTRFIELSKWQDETHGNEEEVGLDDCTQPRTMAHHQEITCKATDNAVEDVLDIVDEAFCSKLIPTDDYIKSVRRLAREQFYARALLIKLNGPQSVVRTIPSAPINSSYHAVENKPFLEDRINVQKSLSVDSVRSIFELSHQF